MQNPSVAISREIPKATVMHRHQVVELITAPTPQVFEWFRDHPEHSKAFVFVEGRIIDLDQFRTDYEGKY